MLMRHIVNNISVLRLTSKEGSHPRMVQSYINTRQGVHMFKWFYMHHFITKQINNVCMHINLYDTGHSTYTVQKINFNFNVIPHMMNIIKQNLVRQNPRNL